MDVELLDFTSPDPLSSVTIEVEGQHLYVHKEVLAIWSPVFRSMFMANFREKEENCVPLPGKKVEDMIELFHCVYPPIKPINESNVNLLLPLVEEYQMLEVKKKCEEFLLTKPGSMELLVIGQQYGLHQLMAKCVDQVKRQNFSDLQRDPCFDKLEPENLISILQLKVMDLEECLEQNRKVYGDRLARLYGILSDLSSGYGAFCADCKTRKINDNCANCLKMYRDKVKQKCDEARSYRNSHSIYFKDNHINNNNTNTNNNNEGCSCSCGANNNNNNNKTSTLVSFQATNVHRSNNSLNNSPCNSLI